MKLIPYLSLALLSAFVGCKKAEVTTYSESKKNTEPYQMPRETEQPHNHQHDTESNPHQNAPFMKKSIDADSMVAAIIPLGEKTCFVKMTGSKEEIVPQANSLIMFISSIDFTKEPLNYKLQENWEKVDKKSAFRHSSFTVKNTKLDISISFLGGNGGGDLSNINRWRGQLGLPAIGEEQLANVSRIFPLGTGKMRFVRISREAQSTTTAPTQAPAKAIEKEDPFKYTTPKGWVKTPATSMRLLAFKISKDDKSAALTVFKFGRMGTINDNVNRWRKQVGLTDVTEAENAKITTKLSLDGKETQLMLRLFQMVNSSGISKSAARKISSLRLVRILRNSSNL